MRMYSAIILNIVYGMNPTNMHDKYIQIAQSAITALSRVQLPGRFWIEFLPILKYVPSWLPGAYFKQWARQYAPVVNQMVDQPFDAIIQDIVRITTFVSTWR